MKRILILLIILLIPSINAWCEKNTEHLESERDPSDQLAYKYTIPEQKNNELILRKAPAKQGLVYSLGASIGTVPPDQIYHVIDQKTVSTALGKEGWLKISSVTLPDNIKNFQWGTVENLENDWNYFLIKNYLPPSESTWTNFIFEANKSYDIPRIAWSDYTDFIILKGQFEQKRGATFIYETDWQDFLDNNVKIDVIYGWVNDKDFIPYADVAGFMGGGYE